MAQDRRKTRDVSMDRISSLPETIICHILSFLPTRDAVKTTLLSAKFLNLWKNITTLRFSYRVDTNDEKTRRFVNFVNRFFYVLQTACMDKFSIELSGFEMRDFSRDNLSKWGENLCYWAAAAVSKNVKILEVSYDHGIFKPRLQFPSIVFAYKALEILQLSNIVVMSNGSNSVCLPNLRILDFEDVSIQGDECIDKIVSGCSSLHTFYLKRIESFDFVGFSICSPTLEHLTIISSVRNSSTSISNVDTPSSDSEEEEEIGDSLCRIEIDAPALKFLHLKQTMLKHLLIKTSSPLIEAEISLSAAKFDQGTFDNLIQSLSNGKLLVLDVSDVWLADIAPLRLLPMFPNLTSLTLWNFSGQFNFLKELLRKLPTLETLDLECVNSRGSSFGDLTPGYTSPLLKMVKVKNFYGTKNQVRALEYILLNASMLKTMKIVTPPHSGREVELLQEISNFQRKSMNCRITFH